jgi:hypothetical protein
MLQALQLVVLQLALLLGSDGGWGCLVAMVGEAARQQWRLVLVGGVAKKFVFF